MSRSGFGGPKLPKALLGQIGGAPQKKKKKHFAPRRVAPSRPPPQSCRPIAKPKTKIVELDSEPESELEADVTLDEDDDDEDNQSGSDVEEPRRSASPVVSKRAAKAGLVDNDAEIAALEKKLGMKGKSKSTIDDDELDFLLGSDSDGDGDGKSLKRKRSEDAKWLREKRHKAAGAEESDENDPDEESEVEGHHHSDDMENPFSDDELSATDFDAFKSDTAEPVVAKRPRENPYVAPVSQDVLSTIKYIPPSLRKAAASDEETIKQLRKQIQGQLNRLSEANIISILQAVEQIYEKNARQHVTSTLIDLLVGLVGDPSVLNDTFLILHAGFSAALYKAVGTDFGAQLLERVVETFEKHRGQSSDGKERLNILAFLSNLYQFQVVGSAIVFDYIRLLLDDISENSTELLLRIVRTSGMQLRQEDPTALKDIVLLLHRNTAKVGEEKLSVRTKFMIETINSLKNNRMKTGQGASALAVEHTARMKKSLGTVKTRSFKTTEPLRITLADIRDAEKKGKWWLVGASYHDPAKLVQNEASKTTKSKDTDADTAYDSETGLPDLAKLARAQGMNNDIRRAIFITLLSAGNVEDGYMRLLKLNLKSKQQFEIPRILLHCVGAEEVYNPYYALIARKFCGDHKLRKAWQFALWDIFRRMGERGNGDDGDNDDGNGEAEVTISKIVNLAKFYGTLTASDGLRVTLLKILDFTHLHEKTSMFVEVLLTTVLIQLRKKNKSEGGGVVEAKTKEVFTHAHAPPAMVQGLKSYVSPVLAHSDLARGKNAVKAMKEGVAVAIAALTEVPAKVAGERDHDDYGDSGSEY